MDTIRGDPSATRARPSLNCAPGSRTTSIVSPHHRAEIDLLHGHRDFPARLLHPAMSPRSPTTRATIDLDSTRVKTSSSHLATSELAPDHLDVGAHRGEGREVKDRERKRLRPSARWRSSTSTQLPMKPAKRPCSCGRRGAIQDRTVAPVVAPESIADLERGLPLK
jgi:hypothetical protein